MLSIEERVALLKQSSDEETLREQVAILKKAIEWLEMERYYLEGRIDYLTNQVFELEKRLTDFLLKGE